MDEISFDGLKNSQIAEIAEQMLGSVLDCCEELENRADKERYSALATDWADAVNAAHRLFAAIAKARQTAANPAQADADSCDYAGEFDDAAPEMIHDVAEPTMADYGNQLLVAMGGRR